MSCACSCDIGSALCCVVTTKTEIVPASAMPMIAMAMTSSRSVTPSSRRAPLVHIPGARFNDERLAAAERNGLVQVRHPETIEPKCAGRGIRSSAGRNDLILRGARRADQRLVARRRAVCRGVGQRKLGGGKRRAHRSLLRDGGALRVTQRSERVVIEGQLIERRPPKPR